MANTISSPHPAITNFVVGFFLIVVLAWFANVSEDTGNIGASLMGLLWLLYLMKNVSTITKITP